MGWSKPSTSVCSRRISSMPNLRPTWRTDARAAEIPMLPSDQVTETGQLQQRRRASYNRLAPIYDWISGPSETALRQEGLRLLAPRLGERLLEIGFGTGQALPHL